MCECERIAIQMLQKNHSTQRLGARKKGACGGIEKFNGGRYAEL